jgi:hypothetical protein
MRKDRHRYRGCGGCPSGLFPDRHLTLSRTAEKPDRADEAGHSVREIPAEARDEPTTQIVAALDQMKVIGLKASCSEDDIRLMARGTHASEQLHVVSFIFARWYCTELGRKG